MQGIARYCIERKERKETNPCSKRILTCSFSPLVTAKWSRSTSALISMWTPCDNALFNQHRMCDIIYSYACIHGNSNYWTSSCSLKASAEPSSTSSSHWIIIFKSLLLILDEVFWVCSTKRESNSTEDLFAASWTGESATFAVAREGSILPKTI